ncbi:DUF4374 domain-containing protein [Flavivirga algicola]|uniref:DUF4374 domain-containing protein n=1 Tax=Flavivirga algicola TaxID=2729136 RepID=A0ABX1RY27_9FLAO|nr:DUF4374 domain-containing protein [Flavivirga algicola]NMH87235.1 DUF4374 domain-containing protein [Flavivirga algicola]
MKQLFNYTIKMKHLVKPSFYVKVLCAIFAIGLISCSKTDNRGSETPPSVDDGKSKFAIWLQLGTWPNTTQYVAGVNDITTGSVSLDGNGDEVTSKADYGIVANGDGYYYYPSSSTDFGKMTKFEYKDDKMQVVKEVPFTYQNAINDHLWVDDTTLVFLGYNGDYNEVIYTVLNTETLEINNGNLELPAIPNEYLYLQIAGSEYNSGKIFLTFNYTKEWPETGDLPIYLAEITYPSMNVASVSEETRTLGTAGGGDMWEPTSTKDELNDIYMMLVPSFVYEKNNPSAVFRIKNGDKTFDENYFFNLTETLGSETDGMTYIGNGKAIISYTDGQISENESYRGRFALVDLRTSSLVKKLELPLDNATTVNSVLVDNGKAYIIINTETEKDYIWEVDPSTGAVKPGIEIVGGYDYILRIDKLKK